MIKKIKDRLKNEAEADYQKFSSALIPNIDNVLGIRIPVLRRIAKEIYANENFREFLAAEKAEFMEETMLKGMIIGLVKDSPENILELVKNFVPQIDNWSVCDCFCSGLKFTKNNKPLVWNFLQHYLNSDKEYEIRFAIVMLLNYFVEEKYIDKVLKILDETDHEGYYAKMAVAWAVSVCFAKHEKETFEYLKKSKLNEWTFNKSIQKCLESYRVSDKMKKILKKMKK